MRYALVFLIFTQTAGCELYTLHRRASTIDQTVPHGEQCLEERQGESYRCWDIFIPDDLPDGPVPLVIDMHGFLNRPGTQRDFSRFEDLAVEEGFIVVWPYGINWSWNGGGDPWVSDFTLQEEVGVGCCGHALNEGIDDAGFLREMVSQLQREHALDQDRLFLSGFSNGCVLAQRMATEMSDLLDGVACMAGVLMVEAPATYTPIPVLEIHGTEDSVVSYEPDYWPGAMANFETWRELNQCTGATEEVWREGEHTMIQATECASGATVALLTLVGFDHPVYQGEDGLEIDTTRMAWDFLDANAAQ